jgi:APA family basic amino acid/polyamine antiporter
MTAAAVLVLRKKQPDLVRPYRTLGYPVVPLLFVIGAIILLFSTALERPRESAIGLGLMALGLPFYYHWKRQRAR